MPTIYDNIENHLIDGLSQVLEVSNRADFCVGYFNLRGWKKIASQIDHWNGSDDNKCRLLIGMHRTPQSTVDSYFNNKKDLEIDAQTATLLKRRLAKEFKDQLTVGIPTEADERGLRKLSSQLKAGKVTVKLFLKHPLHAKLYLLFRNDKVNPVNSFLGSSNLTLAGLAKQGELNIDVQDKDANQKLVTWFETQWNENRCHDISEQLAEIIDTSWAGDHSPYQIYVKIAYHLSREARAGLAENQLSPIFEKELLDFQKNAVKIAARHLSKRGGVIIGDVVGLGKTITGTALAKLMEDDHGYETLILCPKNLTKMWEYYAHRYHLRAKILSVTQAQAELPELRRYRVVMIDESHNLRNREGKRYKIIQEYIQRNGSKVIMLSATPYNKTFIDLSNQLRLFLPEDQDLGITPEQYINSIGGRTAFLGKFQTPIGSLAAFEKSDFVDDWRQLMGLYLVRRTRGFIKNNFTEEDRTDPKNIRKYLTFADGRRSYFPDRLVRKVVYDFDPNDPTDQYAKLYSEAIVSIINSLNLPRYGLGTAQYTAQKPAVPPTKAEIQIQANLGRAGARLKGFARTNLFKRLESSGHAFLLSISRHILRNYLFLFAIQNQKPLPIGKQDANMLDDFLEDDDIFELEAVGEDTNHGNKPLLSHDDFMKRAGQVYTAYETKYKNRFDWIGSHLFSENLTKTLKNDCENLMKILETGKDWSADNDRQLNALYDLCHKKHGKEKILIFTQFADTANYLYQQLSKRGLESVGCVTGDVENPTEFAHRFSPESNLIKNVKDELKILITTDVLSEGQNLQDAHIVLNYDLPWAIIRLIQRAGRVDRIGQKSDKIYCYSFLPEDGIEKIINLRGRLKQRLEDNDGVIGSDELFFDDQKTRTHLENIYNEKSGILDDEDDTEIDLASYAYQIWKDAIEKDPSLSKSIPDLPEVVYATKAHAAQNGVIVYARTAEDNDVLSWLGTDKEIITQSQLTILKTVACEPNEKSLLKWHHHHELVQTGVAVIKEMEKNTGGQLGRQTGMRYRLYHLLKRYYEQHKGTIFVTDALERTIDDVYKFPLKETAKEKLSRYFKTNMPEEDTVKLALSLRNDHTLCNITDEDTTNQEPQIICSMGLK